MGIHFPTLRHWSIPDIEHRYSIDDSMLYALGLGLGQDPMDEYQLQFVNETRDGWPLALPTMAVILGYPGSWLSNPDTGVDFSKVVHGEEYLLVHRPLPASGTVISRHRMTGLVDKGAGKGATITYDKELFDKSSGDLLVTVTHTTFARGDGGFSVADGLTDQALPARAPVPSRVPDRVASFSTHANQALLYRLSADRNPLHSDPRAALAVGFKQPILHGLCTYGIAGHVLLAHCGQGDPARMRSLFARFSGPVYPGDTLDFDMFDEGEVVRFRARARERNALVLDYGLAEFVR